MLKAGGYRDGLRCREASGENYSRVKRLVETNHLHTICTSGNCPNIGECWNAGTATFMILATSAPGLANSAIRKQENPRPLIQMRLSALQNQLRLLNSALCDNLCRQGRPSDGGSSFWAEVIKAVKKKKSGNNIRDINS